MQNYIEKVKQLQPPSFQQIRKIANSYILNLSKEESNELYDRLNRGVNLLGTHKEMCKYLHSFGNMHEAKIKDAVRHLPKDIFQNEFEIVDWGCGQGIGTVCFFDYLKKQGFNINVKKVTLIEPSKKALNRAALHVYSYLNDNSKIKTFQKYLDDVTTDDIQSYEETPVIHFFSNILDIKEIDLKSLANKINDTTLADNYIVCVGPLNSGNHRIDAFYNYFDVPVLYEQENSQFPIGNNKTKTYKAKVYKLEYTKEGNLIPIEFYPSVQFHAAYQLDAVRENLNNHTVAEKQEINNLYTSLTHFETATPFDIGASVYDDIHPILAVLNNLVARGLPTKASPFIEQTFLNAFGHSKKDQVRGEMIFKSQKNNDLNHLLTASTESIKSNENKDDAQLNIIESQLVLSPIAIARIQKTILEALMTDKLSIDKGVWKIMVEERDVPCAALGFKDLEQMFNSLTQLSTEYQNLKFPKIKLDIISPHKYVNSPLHLNCETSSEITSTHKEKTYDLVIDLAVLQKSEIEANSFSQFQVLNNCYFNIRSCIDRRSERTIYTTDLIQYRDLVSKDAQGTYTDIEEAKDLLTYFLQLLFRKTEFRPGQLPILNRALQNKGVIGLLPTGGGKSLTYQIAALLQPGVTLIVDPLKALMKDQFDGLIKAGIDSCAFINSELSSTEKENVETNLEESKLQFIFLSPERLAIYKFRKRLMNMHNLNVYFSYGVIDEVHCVSEWGHDFRFSYLHLGRNLYNFVKAKKGNISLFGLTATASFDVLADVERELSGNGAFPLDSETIVRYENSNRLELQYKIEKVNVSFQDEITALKASNFANPAKIKNLEFKYKYLTDRNLPLPVKIADKWGFYEAKQEFLKAYVTEIPKYLKELQHYKAINTIKNTFAERQGNNEGLENNLTTSIDDDYYSKRQEYNQSGIIFCPHKKNTGIAVKPNRDSIIGICPDVGTFSGGDDSEGEEEGLSMKNLELFRDNKQPLMIATKAFGMGIDKPNVRFTVNMNYSSSLESFVQEAGRSGRDRKMALATILLSDYKLVRINNKQPSKFGEALHLIKNKWFNQNDLNKIIKRLNLTINKENLDFLTPENDLVRIFCKDGTNSKYFGFNNCADIACSMFKKCLLRKLPKEAENWIFKNDLENILNINELNIDKKYIEYQNADYETVMYFYGNSFKGELVEKTYMLQILNQQETDVFFEDDCEIKPDETDNVKGFLTTVLNAPENKEIVSFIKYVTHHPGLEIEGNDTDIAKAIYRMTCIGLIDDFTQDYANNRYRIVSKRKEEGAYYKALNNFLLRYYSYDRADEELKKVFNIRVKSETELQKEIFQCLSYLTTFVYEKISVKRKRAIDDMRTFCITGVDDSKDWKDRNEELKDFIYYYFNSKYAKEDYIADNDEPYSLTIDTQKGKFSSSGIVFKYLKVIDDNIESGAPIDNVKHLQGAVRILRRSLTDSNPALALLNAFCLFFLGTNKNENLEIELLNSYKEGMDEFENRINNGEEFWSLFNNYNSIIGQFADKKQFSQLKKESMVEIHEKKINNITDNYLA